MHTLLLGIAKIFKTTASSSHQDALCVQSFSLGQADFHCFTNPSEKGKASKEKRPTWGK